MILKRFAQWKRLIGYSVLVLMLSIVVFDITENILSSAPFPQKAFEEKYAEMNNVEACDCWWPIWANRDAFSEKDRVVAGGRIVTISDWDRESRQFTIDTGDAGNARIATWWYPHWKAEINGSPVSLGKDANGAITIPLPPERSEVRLYFEEPRFLSAAELTSLITWIGLLISMVLIFVRRDRNRLNLAALE